VNQVNGNRSVGASSWGYIQQSYFVLFQFSVLVLFRRLLHLGGCCRKEAGVWLAKCGKLTVRRTSKDKRQSVSCGPEPDVNEARFEKRLRFVSFLPRELRSELNACVGGR
jgi:hypothetical protein